MQITINTSDILGDETTIRDEVIEQVAKALYVSMKKQAEDELTKMLKETLAKVVSEIVEEATIIAVDTEFTDMDEYGRPGKTKSLRARIADHMQAQCVFKSSRYSNDENRFTQVVKEVIEKELSKFKSEFNSLVTKQVIEQSMDMAVSKLREALGIR